MVDTAARWEPAIGDVVRERQYNGQERVIRSIHGDWAEVQGIASGRVTRVRLTNLRRRYRLADPPFNRDRRSR